MDASGISDIMTAGGDLAVKLRQAITGEGDPGQKLSQIEAILSAVQVSDVAQSAVNAQEAQSTSWFIAAWRPAIGWCCVFGFAITAVIFPLLGVCGIHLPPIDNSMILTTLGGMLGIGTMRTVEKIQGVSEKH